MSRGGKREGAGRPPVPHPLKTRSMRLTDEEYVWVKQRIKRRRKLCEKFIKEDNK
jgi:hypothetical protein